MDSLVMADGGQEVQMFNACAVSFSSWICVLQVLCPFTWLLPLPWAFMSHSCLQAGGYKSCCCSGEALLWSVPA